MFSSHRTVMPASFGERRPETVLVRNELGDRGRIEVLGLEAEPVGIV